MTRSTVYLATILLLFIGFRSSAQITVTQPIPQSASIEINVAQAAGETIPRTIFGTFLEPIGSSTYGGLWGEILQNPSLEAGLWSAPNAHRMVRDEPALSKASQLGLPLPWEPLNYAQGNRYEVRRGDAANSWQSLAIFGLPDQPTGIRQKVYLPVHRTLQYTGSLYVKHLSGPTGLSISLRTRNGSQALASAQVLAPAASWTKYKFALTLPPDRLHRLDPADFVLQVQGNERVQVDQFSLMPADAIDGFDPDELAMAKAMNTPLVRFGGNFTSGYHWQDGTGARDKRVSMQNLAWGIPEYNTFGTDEFLDFCRLIGAQPQFALNMGSGTPEEGAAWVRYIRRQWHPHGGMLWELGNELWGDWNVGYPTPDQIAGRTQRFSRAVRAVDPDARLIATGADPNGFAKWNAAQLASPAGTFNYLSTHFVVGTGTVKAASLGPDFIASAALALPVELGRSVQSEQRQINQFPAFANQAHVAFTEWLFASGAAGVPSYTNLGGALEAGGFLNMLMRNSSIVPISDMTGIMEFGGIWKKRSQVYAAPAYYAFRMYSSAHASRTVSVQTNAGMYSVKNGVTRLPDIVDVPYLDVVAAVNDSGDTLTLFCVNRSLQTDIASSIHVSGMRVKALAEVQTLSGTSLDDSNSADEPERVIPSTATERLQKSALHHIFPHESVTVITLQRAR